MERLTEPMIVPSTGEFFCYRLKPGVSEWKLKNKLGAYETDEEQGLLLRLPTGKDRSDLIYILLKLLLRTEWGHCYMCSNPMKNITIDGKNNGCDGECNVTEEFDADDLLTKILREIQTKAEAEKALAEMG